MLDDEIYKEIKNEIADISRNCGMDDINIEVGLTNECPIMEILSNKGYPKVTVWHSLLPEEMLDIFEAIKHNHKTLNHIKYVGDKPSHFLYVMRLAWNS